jgi:hypothetical protein
MPMAAPFQWGLLKAHESTLRPLVAAGWQLTKRFEPKCYFFAAAAIAAAAVAAVVTR